MNKLLTFFITGSRILVATLRHTLFSRLIIILVFALQTIPVALAVDPDPGARSNSSSKALELIRQIEDMYRGESSYAELSMTIETPHWQRTMSMEAWSKGVDLSFIRILSPKKDTGITTLKINSEMWNFFPKINKTIKVPPSMMMGAWMGSDFTNDDLVRESRLTEDYWLSLDEGSTTYTVILTPKEDTATVWAKISILIKKDTGHPVKQIYYDESGTAIRVLEYSALQNYNGTLLPSRMTMTPLNKENHKTSMVYQRLDLNVKVDDSLFTLRNLKKRSR